MAYCDALSPRFIIDGEPLKARPPTEQEMADGSKKCNADPQCTFCDNFCAPLRVQERFTAEELNKQLSSLHDDKMEVEQKIMDLHTQLMDKDDKVKAGYKVRARLIVCMPACDYMRNCAGVYTSKRVSM